MTFSAHPFARDDLPRLNAFISSNAAARAPAPVYLMTSDVAWRMPGSASKTEPAPVARRCGSRRLRLVRTVHRHGVRHPARSRLRTSDRRRHARVERCATTRVRTGLSAFRRFAIDGGVERGDSESARAPLPTACATSRRLRSMPTRSALRCSRRTAIAPRGHFMPDYRRDLHEPIPPTRLDGPLRLRHVTEADLRRTGRGPSRFLAAQQRGASRRI